eukprot:SAG31_NODE_62_length_28678_cov_21.548270_29_plen_112_part_00
MLNVQTSVDGCVNVSLIAPGPRPTLAVPSSLSNEAGEADAMSAARVVAKALPIVGNNVATRVQWVVDHESSDNVTVSGLLPASVQQGDTLQLCIDMSYSDLYGFEFKCISD